MGLGFWSFLSPSIPWFSRASTGTACVGSVWLALPSSEESNLGLKVNTNHTDEQHDITQSTRHEPLTANTKPCSRTRMSFPAIAEEAIQLYVLAQKLYTVLPLGLRSSNLMSTSWISLEQQPKSLLQYARSNTAASG